MKRFAATTPLGELVMRHRSELLAAAETQKRQSLRLFGYLARGDDAGQSDVDFFVTLAPNGRPLDLLSLACDAQEILGVRVDLGTLENLRPEIRTSVAADMVSL